MVVNRHQLHAALGDHVARHRAVDAAGEQQRRLAPGTHGHAAHGGVHGAIQIRLIPDFNGQDMLGLAHVHLQVVLVAHEYVFAHLGVDLGRIQEIVLVRPAGFHLEGAGQALHQFVGLLADALEVVLFHFDGRGNGVDAEHLGDALHAAVQILRAADENAGVMQPHVAPEGLGGFLHALDQGFEKIGPVQALQINFAVANHEQLSHGCFPLLPSLIF